MDYVLFTKIWGLVVFCCLCRISFSTRSPSHAADSIHRVLALWNCTFQALRVLYRQTHWSADYCQSYWYQCVMAAGFNERKSNANVTVDWMAYQGAPMGGVAGKVRISQWWTGTTCKAVNFPSVRINLSCSIWWSEESRGSLLLFHRKTNGQKEKQ